MDFYEQSMLDEIEQSSSSLFNYHDIVRDNMNNGEGLRVVLFLAGCSHRCPKCHNPETWDPNSGVPFTAWDKAELFDSLKNDYIQGITFSGGDPLYSWNRDGVGKLIEEIKRAFPSKDIWLYTGYSLEQDESGSFFFIDKCPWLKNHDSFILDWLGQIDVLVDGPYLDTVRKDDLKKKADPEWRGSSNQRVIDIKKSLQVGSPVLWSEGGRNE